MQVERKRWTGLVGANNDLDEQRNDHANKQRLLPTIMTVFRRHEFPSRRHFIVVTTRVVMLIVVNNVNLNNNHKNDNDTYILSDAMPVLFQGRVGGTVRTLVQGAGVD